MTARLHPRFRPALRLLIGLTVSAALPAGAAWGQSSQPRKSPRKWAVGVDVGVALGGNTPGGSPGQPFQPGMTFTAANGQPSRSIPSWFYGDGAVLFNQVQAQFASRYNQHFTAITPIDAVLTGASAHRSGAAPSFALRATRRISPRYAIDFAFEHRGSGLALTGGAQSALDAARDNFQAALTGLIGTIPQNDVNVTTSVMQSKSGGGQSSLTAEAVITLVTHGKLTVHAIAGGGVLFRGDGSVDVKLTGAYTFSIFGVFPINETDAVTIHVADSGTSALGTVGGGITYDLTPRQGIRVDGRLYLSSSGLTTHVDARPTARRVSPGSVLPSETTPSIQFSTVPNIPTSLSSTATALNTFNGSGLEIRPQVSFGYFVRF